MSIVSLSNIRKGINKAQTPTHLLDAIGNPLCLEKEYVISQNSNGIQTTQFGKLISFGKDRDPGSAPPRVSLLVTKKRHGLWGDFDKEEILETPKKVSVYGINLVPLK